MRDWLMMLAWLISGLLALVAVTWLPAVVVKHFQLRELRARCRGRLALTYDDGPGPQLTPPLLELLKRYQAKATFFLVGFRAQRAPAMCDLIAQAGHELGCHTHWHKKPWKIFPWETARDLDEGYRTMTSWLKPNASFRPPFGKLTTWSWLAARKRRAPLSWWTCDGADTHSALPDPASVARRIVESDGGVVLLHSHDRGDDRHQYVLKVTEKLLAAAQERGLEVCTMSQLLDFQASQADTRRVA